MVGCTVGASWGPVVYGLVEGGRVPPWTSSFELVSMIHARPWQDMPEGCREYGEVRIVLAGRFHRNIV